jgi:hypothetical protein
MADLTTYDPLFLALFANADGTGEISGNGYARLSITNDATVFDDIGASRLSIVPLTTAVATGSGWGVIASVGFYDLSGGGTLLAWVAVDPISVGPAQALSFPAGALGYTEGDPGAITPAQPGLYNIPRSLYLYENVGVEAQSVAARALYLYENVEHVESLAARALYLYENVEHVESLAARALYLYETQVDGEVFPWLMAIDPPEQYRGGQVSLIGDGFGEFVECAAGATITTSSVSGGNVGAFAVDRATNEWVSTSGSGAWIRFSFGAPKTIRYIALEDGTSADWGVPLFRFSDGGPDINGGVAVPDPPLTSGIIPVGIGRRLYALPAPRTTDYVEIRVASGGSGTNRGLREVWIFEDLDQAAETASAILNLGLPTETALGIVSWSNRSAGLYPANGGQPVGAAAVVTVPSDAESGLVVVQETS